MRRVCRLSYPSQYSADLVSQLFFSGLTICSPLTETCHYGFFIDFYGVFSNVARFLLSKNQKSSPAIIHNRTRLNIS